MQGQLAPFRSTDSLGGASRSGADAAIPPGLSTEDARRRLEEFGPNDPAPKTRVLGIRQILPLVANPLAIILIVASVVSATLGEILNATIIITMVVLGVAVNVVQTYRSRVTIERLRSRVAPTATILRDGSWREVPRQEVVPGDVVRLTAGDLVPADAHLVSAKDLHLQEAALTGESLPVEKGVARGVPAGHDDAEAGVVLLGTSVVSGVGTAVVHATGRSTAFGDIAVRVAIRPQETEFERGTRRFGVLIMKTVLVLVFVVVLLNVLLHRGAFESLLFAIALAVGLTPEFLPMITAVTLAQGALHMAKRKVVVKHLAAMQNFGSIDVLCSDKTGTLTTGSMVLDRHIDPFGADSNRALELAYLNSYHETGIRSPLEGAIMVHAGASAAGLDLGRYKKLDEVPFDFERRRLSICVADDSATLLITKGAPENVLEIATSYEVDGRVEPLDAQTRNRCLHTYDDLSGKGYRVLAVAYRHLPRRVAYDVHDEQEMILAGFLAFFDPPLPDASEIVRELHRDGVEVKIVTGDNERVASHVCTQVGLDATEIVLGDELARMDDAALAHVAEKTAVFARVSPAQKNRIIVALKSRSHVVGFLGDGINDAPSLHAADVGISVSTAVDVAKDAAEIILLEPGLRVIHAGIIEGRKAFGNVIKYLLMGTSSNFGNMFSMAGAPLVIPFLPMLPMQILLNNFLYDLAQVTIPTDRVDPTFTIKPRRWDISLVRNFMLLIGPISSIYDFLTFFALLRIFHASESAFHTGWFVESLATQTLVVFVIRTAGNPFRSLPSVPLSVTVIAVVAFGALLPFTALGARLGFTPLSTSYFVFLGGAPITYLAFVEGAKRMLMKKTLGPGTEPREGDPT